MALPRDLADFRQRDRALSSTPTERPWDTGTLPPDYQRAAERAEGIDLALLLERSRRRESTLKAKLTELGLNLWWTWNPEVIELFREIDPGMTVHGLKGARKRNGVSSLHGHVARRMWPGVWSGRSE